MVVRTIARAYIVKILNVLLLEYLLRTLRVLVLIEW